MDKLQQAKELLINSREYLQTEKNEIRKLLKDPRISAWKEIDLSALAEQLRTLGIAARELQKALTDYPRQAKEISRHIKLCNNEIGNQLADLIGNKFPGKALNAAKNLVQTVHQLEELKKNLLTETEKLIAADKTLRQSLTIDSLLPLAQYLADNKQHLFNQGLEIYRLITDQTSAENAPRTFAEICQEAAKMEPRFQHIKIIGLPRLSEEIIYHYIEIGTETLTHVLKFTNATNNLLATDTGAVKNLSHSLSALAKEETGTVLAEIFQYALSLAKLISGLYHKRKLQTSMAAVSDTLEFLNIYHLALKNKIIPSLKEHSSDPQAKINPAVISSKMTRSFFAGPKGILRSMKLMVSSLKGHEAINQVELQLILEKAVNTCKVFYGNSPNDIKKMQNFIDDLISQFAKPFPYNNIFTLVKQTIAAYGNEVENFIGQFEIKKEFQMITTTTIPHSFGKLTTTMLNKKNVFAEANE